MGINDMLSALDDRELRRAFGCFPTGVIAICALVDDRPVGMTASSFNSVSLKPPLASFNVQIGSNTWRSLGSAPLLGGSFLGAGHERVSRQLATKTGDRFSEVDWQASPNGAVFIEGASVWLECSIDRRIIAGDHELVLLLIERVSIQSDVTPLVFHGSRYRQLAAS
jgi:flavin reductase (DIM6/NTAB) family NADH-FMN oxidoreductase RutF